MVITPFAASLLVLLYIALSLTVVKHRLRNKVKLGDGGVNQLNVAIRSHANFIEYVPLSLIMIWFVEVVLFDTAFAFVLAAALVLGRLMHPIGMFWPKSFMILRQLGTVITITVLLAAALRIIWHYVPFGA